MTTPGDISPHIVPDDALWALFHKVGTEFDPSMDDPRKNGGSGFIYCTVVDMEWLIGDMVTGERRFTTSSTPITLGGIRYALAIGASNVINDIAPIVPPFSEDLVLTNPNHLVIKSGLRIATMLGSALAVVDTFTSEADATQSRLGMNRIQRYRGRYREDVEKSKVALSKWPIAITEKPPVFGVGYDFRYIERGDQARQISNRFQGTGFFKSR